VSSSTTFRWARESSRAGWRPASRVLYCDPSSSLIDRTQTATDMRKIIRGSAVFGAGALGLHFAKDALNNWRINRIVHTQYPQAPLPEKPHAASAKQPVASDESSTPTKSKTWTEWFVEGLPIQKVEDVDYQRLLDAKIKVAEYEVRQQERRNARLQQQIQMEQQKVQPQAQAPSPPSNNV